MTCGSAACCHAVVWDRCTGCFPPFAPGHPPLCPSPPPADGTPLVGVEANCRQEMDFFVEGLNRPEPEEGAGPAGGLDPAMAAALGYPAGGGFGAAAYHFGGRRGGGKKKGKKPRYFR